MKYRFYTDPGHGWLEVRFEELFRLGIYKNITPYSYSKGDKVYLEEDCDASLFLKVKKERGENVEINHIHTDNDSPIRGYNSYASGVAISY